MAVAFVAASALVVALVVVLLLVFCSFVDSEVSILVGVSVVVDSGISENVLADVSVVVSFVRGGFVVVIFVVLSVIVICVGVDDSSTVVHVRSVVYAFVTVVTTVDFVVCDVTAVTLDEKVTFDEGDVAFVGAFVVVVIDSVENVVVFVVDVVLGVFVVVLVATVVSENDISDEFSLGLVDSGVANRVETVNDVVVAQDSAVFPLVISVRINCT